MTDRWDPSIPSHKALAHEIEFGNGIPEMRPLSLARQALKTVGFEIEHEEDLADRLDDVPWYYPLEGDISKAQTFWDYLTVWRMSWSGKLVTHNAMRLMEFVGLLPKGTWQVGEALKVAGNALVKGGQTKVCFFVHHAIRPTLILIYATAVYTHVPRCCPETQELMLDSPALLMDGVAC
jgi:sterol 24-C-methyltransferase